VGDPWEVRMPTQLIKLRQDDSWKKGRWRMGARELIWIQADNDPELRGQVLDQWAYEHGVRLQFIEPGKQNAHIESFNARLREKCLNEHVFVSLDDARSKSKVAHPI
jgi:hypothetical protein